MTNSRAMTLTAAVCAALLVAGVAEAGSKKRSSRVATTPAATTPVGNAASACTGAGMGAVGHLAGAGAMGGSFLLDRFDEIDTDKNGQVSRDEAKTWSDATRQQMRQRVEDHVKAADTNGDGQISLEEARAKLPMAASHFEFLDANKDGQAARCSRPLGPPHRSRRGIEWRGMKASPPQAIRMPGTTRRQAACRSDPRRGGGGSLPAGAYAEATGEPRRVPNV